MAHDSMDKKYKTFDAIYDLVQEIPCGHVASYGMVASLIPGATARIVGYAMAATPSGKNIPWQRVLNSSGKISQREGAQRQRDILQKEGIQFNKSDKINWAQQGWQGPSETWLISNKIDFIDFLEIQRQWPGNK